MQRTKVFISKAFALFIAALMICTEFNFVFVISPMANVALAASKAKIEIPSCIPIDAENRNQHIKHLPQFENEKTVAFLNEDGTETFYVYQLPIKYKDKDGEYQYIDTSLMEEQDTARRAAGQKYTTKSSDIITSFPEDIVSDKRVSLKKGDFYIEFKPNVDLRSSEAKQSKSKFKAAEKYQAGLRKSAADSLARAVEYKSSLGDDIDIRYTTTWSGLKEEIILNQYTGQNSFDFIIYTNGVPEVQHDGAILVRDAKSDEVKAFIDRFYAKDSFAGDRVEGDGHITYDIETTITPNEDNENEYLLNIKVDKLFLENRNTIYPVIVDPSLTIPRGDHSDAQVAEHLPNQNYANYDGNRVGWASAYETIRSYVKFDISSLDALDPTAINSAKYHVEQVQDYSSSAYVGAYLVTGAAWSDTTLTWDNKPAYGELLGSELLVNRTGYFDFDIRDAIVQWLTTSNKGIVLKERGEGATKYFREFGSANSQYHPPSLIINYDDEDTKAPDAATNVRLTVTPGSVNSGECSLAVDWTLSTGDLPALHNSGIKEYQVFIRDVSGSYPATPTVTVAGDETDHANAPIDYPDNKTYQAKVVVVDNASNRSSDAVSSQVQAPDRSKPTKPATVTIQGNQWTKSTQPLISWSASSDEGGTISNIQWSTSSNSGFADIGVTTAPGSKNTTEGAVGNLNLSSLSDGTHNFYIRVWDNHGNYCSPAAVGTYKKDTTPPVVTISGPAPGTTVTGIVPIIGSITDASSGIKNWTLEYYKTSDPADPHPLRSDDSAVNNTTIYNWDTSSLDDNTFYTLKLRAEDNAVSRDGTKNQKTVTVQVLKSANAVAISPTLTIEEPAYNAVITDPQMSVELASATGLTGINLIIDGKVVDTDGLSANLTNAVAYPEGSTHRMVVRAYNASLGKYVYSFKSYKSIFSDDFSTPDQLGPRINTQRFENAIQLLSTDGVFATSGTIESNFTDSSITGNISEIKLTAGENKPSGTSITYQVSNDGGTTWKSASLGSTVLFNTPGGNLKVKATLSTTNPSITPKIHHWQADIVFLVDGRPFTVNLVKTPELHQVQKNVNYTNLTVWENSDIDGYNSDTITYNVYRGTSSGFTPGAANRLNSVDASGRGLTQPFWYDNRIKYNTVVYYKVTAVKNVGTEASPIYRESLPSNVVHETFVDQNELEKRFGIESYWKYAGFRTGSGNGYVNVSTGDLTYQSTDFVYPSALLAMAMTRTYNSDATYTSTLGEGWDFSYNTTLLYEEEGDETGDVILKDGDGSIHKFTRNTDGTFKAPLGVFMRLTHNADGTWIIKRNDNIEYLFDKNMLLTGFREPNETYLKVTYNDTGSIYQVKSYIKDTENVSVEHYGGVITFTYNLAGLLDTVTDPAGRVFTYDYNADKRLTSRTVLINQSELYTEHFDYSWDRVSAITDGRNKTTSITYMKDEDNPDGSKEWVKKITFPITTETLTFTYPMGVNYPVGQTVVTNQNGQGTKFDFGSTGLVTKMTDPLGHETAYAYNADKLVTKITTSKSASESVVWEYTYESASANYLRHANILTEKDPYGNITNYRNYDAFNHPGEVEAPISAGNSAKTVFTYDGKGNLKSTIESVTDTLTRTSTNDYYENGLLKTSTDVYGNITTYTYFPGGLQNGKYGWLRTIDSPLSSSTEILEYDKQGNPERVKDAMGVVTRTDYDLLGRQVRVYLPKEDTLSANGWTDDNNWSDHDTQEWVYDLNSNIILQTDAEGRETQFDYDEMDRLKSTARLVNGSPVNPSTISYEYDGGNPLVIKTDPTGVQSREYYDAAGRLVKTLVREAGGTTGEWLKTTYEYDFVGNMEKITDAGGSVSKAQYDKLNRTKSVATDPTGENIVNSFTYDWMGNVLTATNGEKNVTTNTYDKLNRLKTVSQSVDGVSHVTQYAYGVKQTITVNGQSLNCVVNTVTDAASGVKKTYIDALGRVVHEEDMGDDTTNGTKMVVDNQYNKRGEKLKTTYNDGSYTTYTYDCRGQLKRKDFASGGVTGNYNSYSYYGNGALRETQAYRHDTYVENAQTLHAYTKQTMSYAYDVMDRVLQHAQTFYLSSSSTFANGTANIVNYQYDNSGRVKQVAYEASTINADGTAINNPVPSAILYDYDSYGRLAKTSFDNNTEDATAKKLVQEYFYKANGAVDYTKTYRDFKAGGTGFIRKQNTYDTANRLEKIQYYDGTTLKEEYTYTHDKRGYIKIEEQDTNYTGNDKTITITNTYDAIGRLKKAIYHTQEGSTDTTKTTNYTYDKVGNRLTQDDGTDVLSYDYDEFNKLMQIDKKDHGDPDTSYEKAATYAYDTLGRQTEENNWYKKSDGTFEKYSWNVQDYNTAGEMFSFAKRDINNPDGGAEYYFYNVEGKRIRKGTDAVGTNYYYTGGALLYTTGSDIGQKKSENIVTPSGNIIASQRFEGTYANKWYTYNYDIRGSVTNILAPDGSLTKEYTYDSFGVAASSGSFSNEVQFTGAIADGGGVYYMNARYYNANTGRFLTQDSYKGNAYEPWTQHLYTYVGNNPVNMVDPTGHRATEFSNMEEEAGARRESVVPDSGDETISKLKQLQQINQYLAYGSQLANLLIQQIKQSSLMQYFAFNELVRNSSFTSDEIDSLLYAANASTALEKIVAESDDSLTMDQHNWVHSSDAIQNACLYQIKTVDMEDVCFTEDTYVHTKGGYKLIKDIRVGDEVYSQNVDTGEKGLKRVSNVFIKEAKALVYINTGHITKATPWHPFWVEGKGWTSAGLLKQGDRLVSYAGEIVTVTSVNTKQLDIPIKVYNFEVEDWHTYFVSENSILVHNTCALYGGPHGSDQHVDTIMDIVNQMFASGLYSKIYMNRSLNKAGLFGGQRPDIIGIGRNGGNIFIEIRSISQAPGTSAGRELQQKIAKMFANNPGIWYEYRDLDGTYIDGD